MRVPMKQVSGNPRVPQDGLGLSALGRTAPSKARFAPAVRLVFARFVARLGDARKRRRHRAELAKMDYAALQDIGFVSAPWSGDAAASDPFARNLAWSSAKRLRALLSDCSRSRAAAQGDIRRDRLARSPISERPATEPQGYKRLGGF
jgi:uncharacterized protein YjiS (DUF1127 family)